jgi:O-antigen ligase
MYKKFSRTIIVTLLGILQSLVIVNKRSILLIIFESLLIGSLLIPEIFIGVFQSGIHLNISFFPEIGTFRFLPMMSLLAGIAYIVKRWEKMPFLNISKIALSQLLLLLIFAFGITYSKEPERGRQFIWLFGYYNTFLVFLPIIFQKDLKSLRRIVYAFGISSIIVGLSTTILIKKIWYADIGTYSENMYSDERVIGAGIIYLVWIFLNKYIKNGIFRVPLFIILSINLFSLVLIGRRGILFGTLIAASVCIFFKLRLSPKAVLILSFILGALLVVFLLIPDRYREKTFNLETYKDPSRSAQIRLKIYENAINEIKNSPIWGYGTSAGSNPDLGIGLTPYLHNIFLEISYQSGIIGIAAFVLFLYYIGSAAKKILSNNGASKERKAILVLVLCWFIVWFVPAQLSYDLIGNRNMWFIAGLIGALSYF